MRTLILLRHGKSGYPDGVADHERPLAQRGQTEATLAGDWLRATLPPVDAVFCSTATRTRETLAATAVTAPVTFEPRIYEASPHTLIDLLHLTDDHIATLLVIGHAPGMPWTAWELAANRDSDPAERLSRKFPTSAMAVLTFAGDWPALDTGTATLTDFHIPRES